MQIQWENEARGASFDVSWLAAHKDASHPWPQSDEKLGRRHIESADLTLPGCTLCKRRIMRQTACNGSIVVDGWHCLPEGVPVTEDAIFAAMAIVGRVAETNYGLVFDVRSVAQPENLAYSDLGLGLHTDNPYREPVPGFQALHVLIRRA